jgi:hypothetical protein
MFSSENAGLSHFSTPDRRLARYVGLAGVMGCIAERFPPRGGWAFRDQPRELVEPPSHGGSTTLSDHEKDEDEIARLAALRSVTTLIGERVEALKVLDDRTPVLVYSTPTPARARSTAEPLERR